MREFAAVSRDEKRISLGAMSPQCFFSPRSPAAPDGLNAGAARHDRRLSL
ncbi:MAG TPA: hypothetical protein VJA66_03300 [Thermoanaerobaculia bacterium]